MKGTNAMQYNGMNLIKIGKGEFSTVFVAENTDRVFIFTKTSNDDNKYGKDIYCHMDSVHTPAMKTVDLETYIPHMGYCNVYESKLYAKLTANNKDAWRIAKILRQTWESVYRANIRKLQHHDRWYEVCYDYIDTLRDNSNIPESIIHALDCIYSWATAYGPNFLFEFPTRNLKVDQDGNLILLDIVFFRSPKRRKPL
jgi:hypothetical protein